MTKTLVSAIVIASCAVLSSCNDNQVLDTPDNAQKSFTVEGQSAKSVLTLGCLLANHTTIPAGSRATDYGYEYDDDDGVFMSEAEAAALLAPYTQMGNELRRALLLSYFPDKPASRADGGEGGEGDDGGDDEPWRDPTQMENLPDDQQDEVNMLCELTDEEVTEVAIILSSMAFDDSFTQLNGYSVSINHTVDCIVYAVGLNSVLQSGINSISGYISNYSLYLNLSKTQIIKIAGGLIGRYAVPGLGYAAIAYSVYRFVDCMLNPTLMVLDSNEYQQLLNEYQYLTEFSNVVFEISLE